jgi:hypothetical protein
MLDEISDENPPRSHWSYCMRAARTNCRGIFNFSVWEHVVDRLGHQPPMLNKSKVDITACSVFSPASSFFTSAPESSSPEGPLSIPLTRNAPRRDVLAKDRVRVRRSVAPEASQFRKVTTRLASPDLKRAREIVERSMFYVRSQNTDKIESGEYPRRRANRKKTA